MPFTLYVAGRRTALAFVRCVSFWFGQLQVPRKAAACACGRAEAGS